MQDNNIDIFIGTYKSFEPKVTNQAYKVIYGKHDVDACGNLPMYQCVSDEDILDDRFFSEIYMLKNLPKDLPLHDYVGFCHYRKYFNFLDNIPDIDDIFKDYDIILGNPLIFKCCVQKQYSLAHNIEDLELIGKIIKDNFHDYSKSYDEVVQGNILYPYNIFIMRKEMFIKYITFITEVLNEYIKIIGTDIDERINSNKEKYLKSSYPNSTIDYQYRIGGYLAERLTNIFVNRNCNRIKTYSILITDKKYRNEKSIITQATTYKKQ